MRIIMPLLAACLLTGCTQIGGVATTNDGNGVWIATNTTLLGFFRDHAIYFCEKDLDGMDWACTDFGDPTVAEQPK